jgi:antitoxin (DNA-binding transcriptional repressor) of toxin-antitoxin stability system
MPPMIARLHLRAQLCLCTPVDTDSVRTVGVRQLRAGIAEAVRRAGAGERTVITASGRPVAQLGPLDADAPDLERLIGSGAVIPPRRTSGWRPPDPVPVWAGVRIDQVLRELRG